MGKGNSTTFSWNRSGFRYIDTFVWRFGQFTVLFLKITSFGVDLASDCSAQPYLNAIF